MSRIMISAGYDVLYIHINIIKFFSFISFRIWNITVTKQQSDKCIALVFVILNIFQLWLFFIFSAFFSDYTPYIEKIHEHLFSYVGPIYWTLFQISNLDLHLSGVMQVSLIYDMISHLQFSLTKIIKYYNAAGDFYDKLSRQRMIARFLYHSHFLHFQKNL